MKQFSVFYHRERSLQPLCNFQIACLLSPHKCARKCTLIKYWSFSKENSFTHVLEYYGSVYLLSGMRSTVTALIAWLHFREAVSNLSQAVAWPCKHKPSWLFSSGGVGHGYAFPPIVAKWTHPEKKMQLSFYFFLPPDSGISLELMATQKWFTYQRIWNQL